MPGMYCGEAGPERLKKSDAPAAPYPLLQIFAAFAVNCSSVVDSAVPVGGSVVARA